MPSRESLAQQRYYAHSRNAFWPIITELLEIGARDPESRFPAPAYGERRLRSTECNERSTLLVPLAALDLPNQGRRVTCGSYEQCVSEVRRRDYAIWDVLKACFRSGSLDSAIDERSIVTNDFQDFYGHHPLIERVFFNGAKAESMYLKHVLPGLDGPAASLGLKRLPSTSPAHAGMSLEQKKEAWRVVLE